MTLVPRATAGLVAAAGMALAGLVQAAEYDFNLADEYAATSLPGQTDSHFAELVKDKSGGRIEITTHPGGALGFKSRDHYEAVRDGAITFASTPFDKLVGFAPIFTLQSLPFVTPTIEKTEIMFDVARPYYEAAFNQANQTLLLGAPWTPQGIWAKQKIGSVEDLQGLKLRTYDVTGTKTLKAAGAAPIQLTWADVIPALSTNTIVGVLTSDEGGVNSKFWELGAKYFNFLGYSMGINAITMNLDSYNALPPDLQQVLREAAAEAEAMAWERVRTRVQENKKIMADSGAEFVDDVPDVVIDHLMAAGSPLVDEWKQAMGPEAEMIMVEFEERAATN